MLERAGVGSTVIVKLSGEPEQATELYVNVGVTVIIARTGEFPLLMVLKEAILPVPLAKRPIEGFELVQAYVVIPTVLLVVKLTAATGDPLHTS